MSKLVSKIVITADRPRMNKKFETVPLLSELLINLNDLNFSSMTPVQEEALPLILEGNDIVAQAKTGSGKTAAFSLPILNSVDVLDITPKALILCPTRELAEQVAKEIRMLARLMKNVRVLTLCGGVAEVHQEKSLEHGAHIIVGTPGRVLRLLDKEVLHLDKVASFVLDEADRMLDMGFIDDILEIKSNLPEKLQTMLFSATFPKEIEELSSNVQTSAIFIKIDTVHSPTVIQQHFFQVKRHPDKNEALLKVLGVYKPERSIVFCKTKQITDSVAKFLNRSGIVASSIHGDLKQNERTAVLTMFSNRSLSVLVATDVAARGLDIKELEAVINFDLPFDPEVYTHRIGRTGRAGKTGEAFSFFIEQDKFRVGEIEELRNEKFELEDIDELSESDQFNLVPPMKTMYIGGGKKNKLRPGDILGALVGEAKLDPTVVGNISVLNILTYVAIEKDFIEQAVKKLRDSKIKNRKFKVGLV